MDMNRGRKPFPESERRSERFQFLLTQAEAEYVRKVAKDNNVTVSTLVRTLLTDFTD